MTSHHICPASMAAHVLANALPAPSRLSRSPKPTCGQGCTARAPPAIPVTPGYLYHLYIYLPYNPHLRHGLLCRPAVLHGVAEAAGRGKRAGRGRAATVSELPFAGHPSTLLTRPPANTEKGRVKHRVTCVAGAQLDRRCWRGLQHITA
jgi:hypothetical protein